MTPSTKEIEELISKYFKDHDSMLDFMYSIKKDGALCVYNTMNNKLVYSKNILPGKKPVSNTDLNKFLKRFDDKINPREDYTAVDWKIYKYDNSELLEQNNFWKKLSRDLNQRGYELEVFMVDAMNIPAHRGPKARYCEFFVGATQNEDLMKQHKGKIGARLRK